jgi:ribosome biogenesis GTPase / thiamine phosphate phosphatase
VHTGLVLAHHGQASLVETESGDAVRCISRRSLPRTLAGDRVSFELQGPRDGVITAVAERRTTLVRREPRGKLKPVAANIDQIVVVIASRPSFEQGMLDRYLVAAEIIGAQPAVVFNKADLLSGEARARLEQKLALYTGLGYPLIFTSTRTADGLKDLHAQLRHRTSILVGQSGVGKSSLVQALLPDLAVRTGDLSNVTGLGRHTTTAAMLYHLPDGGDLIDSPGVRDFALWPVDAQTLAHGFVEFRPWLGHCKFRNCNHRGEPGCGLAIAVQEGRANADRLARYNEILTSFHEDR